MIAGYVMILAVFTGSGWQMVKPVSEDLYSSYEICMANADNIQTASNEKIICGEVVR